MYRTALAAAAALAVLTLSGCGHGDTSAAAATSSSPAKPTVTVASLCQQYCAPLAAQAQACPIGSSDLHICAGKLAAGNAAVTAVQTALAGIGGTGRPDLLAAIDQAHATYNEWLTAPGPSCPTVDVNNPVMNDLYLHEELLTCAIKATTVSYNQASVGAVLRNAARTS